MSKREKGKKSERRPARPARERKTTVKKSLAERRQDVSVGTEKTVSEILRDTMSRRLYRDPHFDPETSPTMKLFPINDGGKNVGGVLFNIAEEVGAIETRRGDLLPMTVQPRAVVRDVYVAEGVEGRKTVAVEALRKALNKVGESEAKNIVISDSADDFTESVTLALKKETGSKVLKMVWTGAVVEME